MFAVLLSPPILLLACGEKMLRRLPGVRLVASVGSDRPATTPPSCVLGSPLACLQLTRAPTKDMPGCHHAGLTMGLNFLFTQNGKTEHKNPFLAMLAPTWLPQAYPELAKALRGNEQRLLSAFDM